MYTVQEDKDTRWQIVPQTKIAFVGYLLILIAMMIYLLQQPSNFMVYLPQIIAYVLVYILSLYIINCTVLGKCNLYAWIMSYIVLVIAIIVVLGLIFKLVKS